MDLSGDVVEERSFDVSFFRGRIEEFGWNVHHFGNVVEGQSDRSEAWRNGQLTGEVCKIFCHIAQRNLNGLNWSY